MKHGGNEKTPSRIFRRRTTREEVAWVCADDANDRERVSKLEVKWEADPIRT